MSVRFQVAALIFMLVQAVLFGAGTMVMMATPLAAFATPIWPWVIGVSALVSVPLSWVIAPRLLAQIRNRPSSAPPTVVG
jgi:hypothetical protein